MGKTRILAEFLRRNLNALIASFNEFTKVTSLRLENIDEDFIKISIDSRKTEQDISLINSQLDNAIFSHKLDDITKGKIEGVTEFSFHDIGKEIENALQIIDINAIVLSSSLSLPYEEIKDIYVKFCRDLWNELKIKTHNHYKKELKISRSNGQVIFYGSIFDNEEVVYDLDTVIELITKDINNIEISVIEDVWDIRNVILLYNAKCKNPEIVKYFIENEMTLREIQDAQIKNVAHSSRKTSFPKGKQEYSVAYKVDLKNETVKKTGDALFIRLSYIK